MQPHFTTRRRTIPRILLAGLLGAFVAAAYASDEGPGGPGTCYDLISTDSFTDMQLDSTGNCSTCFRDCAGMWTRCVPGTTFSTCVSAGAAAMLSCEGVPAYLNTNGVCVCASGGSGQTVAVKVTNQIGGRDC